MNYQSLLITNQAQDQFFWWVGIHLVRQWNKQRNHQEVAKGAGLQGRCADKREAGSRKRAGVWQQCKFTCFTMPPVLPVATLRKKHEIQGRSAPGLQGAGGRRKRPGGQCPGPLLMLYGKAWSWALHWALSLTASSPHHHSSFWGGIQCHDYAHCCSFLFTRNQPDSLGPSHLIPTIIPSLSSQSTSLSAFNPYSSTSFFLQSASSSFSSQREFF